MAAYRPIIVINTFTFIHSNNCSPKYWRRNLVIALLTAATMHGKIHCTLSHFSVHCSVTGSARITAQCPDHCTVPESLHSTRIIALCPDHCTVPGSQHCARSLHRARITTLCPDHYTVPGSLHSVRITALCPNHCTVPGSLHSARITALCPDHCTVPGDARPTVQYNNSHFVGLVTFVIFIGIFQRYRAGVINTLIDGDVISKISPRVGKNGKVSMVWSHHWRI